VEVPKYAVFQKNLKYPTLGSQVIRLKVHTFSKIYLKIFFYPTLGRQAIKLKIYTLYKNFIKIFKGGFSLLMNG
jgi:hypothetical protein